MRRHDKHRRNSSDSLGYQGTVQQQRTYISPFNISLLRRHFPLADAASSPRQFNQQPGESVALMSAQSEAIACSNSSLDPTNLGIPCRAQPQNINFNLISDIRTLHGLGGNRGVPSQLRRVADVKSRPFRWSEKFPG